MVTSTICWLCWNCRKHKINPYGLCTNCGRFPTAAACSDANRALEEPSNAPALAALEEYWSRST